MMSNTEKDYQDPNEGLEYIEHNEQEGMLYPAMVGDDFDRDGNHQPRMKSRKGWQRIADQIARKQAKAIKLPLDGIVCWVPWRNCYRLNVAKPEKGYFQ